MIEGHHFLWGAGTAPYQVEGGIINNDWDFFTSSESIKKRISRLTRPNIFYKSTETFLQTAGNATNFWDPRYYEKDFDLARDLGLNAFRIGIEWARIEPERGHWDQEAIEHYKEMIKAMRIRGLMPVITLNHITLPRWVLTPPSNFTKRSLKIYCHVHLMIFRSGIHHCLILIGNLLEVGKIMKPSKNSQSTWKGWHRS